MRVSDLYGTLEGKDVYIVGTGPSMSVFPVEYLRDKACVLLNDAWKYFPTLGPFAFSNTKKFLKSGKTKISSRLVQIVKARLKSDPNPKRDDNHVPWNHEKMYCFSYRQPPWDDVSHFDKKLLWKEPCHYWNIKGGTVAIFAVQFAIMAGAKSILLVGCDCCDLSGEEYVNDKALRFRLKNTKKPLGASLQHNYTAYYKGLLYLADRALRDRGVPVMSCTPFFGLKCPDVQFDWMRR